MKFKEGDLVKSNSEGCYTSKSEGTVVKEDKFGVMVKLTKAKNKKNVGREILFTPEELEFRETKTLMDELVEVNKKAVEKLADRFNSGKPKLSYVHPIIMEEIARVMEYGAKKYARDNWRKGLKINDILDSALRHLMDFKEGVDLDEESGQTQLGHLACNVMFAMYVLKYKPELDDRVKEII